MTHSKTLVTSPLIGSPVDMVKLNFRQDLDGKPYVKITVLCVSGAWLTTETPLDAKEIKWQLNDVGYREG